MALSVDKVFQFVQFVANKESRGWIAPAEFNIAAELAQIAVYSRLEAQFLSNKKIHNDMRPFLNKSGTLVPTGGLITYPNDFRHFITARDTTGTRITEYTQAEWGDALESTIIAPTSAYPACVLRSDGIEVYPITTQAIVEYVAKLTTVPTWGYTLVPAVTGRPVYSVGTSTQFEFEDNLFTEIATNILMNVGMNIGRESVAQYGMAFNKAA
jgi:hypothetical protein